MWKINNDWWYNKCNFRSMWKLCCLNKNLKKWVFVKKLKYEIDVYVNNVVILSIIYIQCI